MEYIHSLHSSPSGKPCHHLLYDFNRVGNLSHQPLTLPPSFPKEKSTQRTTSIRKNTYCMILFIQQSRESKIELWGRKSESSCLVEGKGWWFSWLERGIIELSVVRKCFCTDMVITTTCGHWTLEVWLILPFWKMELRLYRSSLFLKSQRIW